MYLQLSSACCEVMFQSLSPAHNHIIANDGRLFIGPSCKCNWMPSNINSRYKAYKERTLITELAPVTIDFWELLTLRFTSRRNEMVLKCVAGSVWYSCCTVVCIPRRPRQLCLTALHAQTPLVWRNRRAWCKYGAIAMLQIRNICLHFLI